MSQMPLPMPSRPPNFKGFVFEDVKDAIDAAAPVVRRLDLPTPPPGAMARSVAEILGPGYDANFRARIDPPPNT